MLRLAKLLRRLVFLLPLWSASAAWSADWDDALGREIDRIDRETPGQLGVYVKRLADGSAYSHGADRFWYLGSTVKVPIAIAVLRRVDEGQLKLTDRVTLQAGDKIEAGPLVWQRDGRSFTIDELLPRMLRDSDNTGANMLMRTAGEERVTALAKAAMGAANVERITTLAQVRYDVYAEIHPRARTLSNDQLVRIASAPMGPQRVEAVRRALNLKTADMQAKTMDEAYERYYARRLNSATLDGYGALLEKLVRGQLLSPAGTRRMFDDMKLGIFTNYRLQAGLPREVPFIHKTGTQHRTACHAGVIDPEDGGADAIVAVTCAADVDEQHEAGRIFERVGEAITHTLLAERTARR